MQLKVHVNANKFHIMTCPIQDDQLDHLHKKIDSIILNNSVRKLRRQITHCLSLHSHLVRQMLGVKKDITQSLSFSLTL